MNGKHWNRFYPSFHYRTQKKDKCIGTIDMKLCVGMIPAATGYWLYAAEANTPSKVGGLVTFLSHIIFLYLRVTWGFLVSLLFFPPLHVWCSFYYNYISSICSLMVFWSPLRPSVFTSEVFKITTSARSPQKRYIDFAWLQPLQTYFLA